MKRESWRDGYEQRDLESFISFQRQYLNNYIISLMQKFVKVGKELLTLQLM